MNAGLNGEDRADNPADQLPHLRSRRFPIVSTIILTALALFFIVLEPLSQRHLPCFMTPCRVEFLDLGSSHWQFTVSAYQSHLYVSLCRDREHYWRNLRPGFQYFDSWWSEGESDRRWHYFHDQWGPLKRDLFAARRGYQSYLFAIRLDLLAQILLALFLLRFAWYVHRRKVRRFHLRCEVCGYDLQGSTGDRCSECGEPRGLNSEERIAKSE